MLATLAVLAGSLAAPATAADFPFAEDEVIRLIVPYRPGGGYDRITRLVQPALAEALSAQAGREVTVIVENRTGAGGRIAYEHLYGSPPEAPRVLLLDNQGAALQQIALDAGFDLARFTYIGQVNNSTTAIQVRADLGLGSLADLVERAKSEPILFGTAGAGSSGHIATLIVQSLLRDQGVSLPMDFVHFNGSKEVLASMQRGEVEAFLGSVSSTLAAIKEGYAVNAVVFGRARSPFDPSAPTAFEQDVPGATTITEATRTSRIFIAPPGMPEARAKSLRQALKTALHSPVFLEAAKAARLPVIYQSAEEARETVMQHRQVLLGYEKTIREALGGS
ncbi:MAG: tripartite tricarboxylate transporter substrate binding protein [Kiloniellales bacterium]|nr:tripartite tricarboxylate transporter substrate binding protein [Kiloniellales bacterium]